LERIDQKVQELSEVLVVPEKLEPPGASGKDVPVCRVAIESPHSMTAFATVLHRGSGGWGDFLDTKNDGANKKDGASC
jgi:hypothetical protein